MATEPQALETSCRMCHTCPPTRPRVGARAAAGMAAAGRDSGYSAGGCSAGGGEELEGGAAPRARKLVAACRARASAPPPARTGRGRWPPRKAAAPPRAPTEHGTGGAAAEMRAGFGDARGRLVVKSLRQGQGTFSAERATRLTHRRSGGAPTGRRIPTRPRRRGCARISSSR